MLCSSVWNSPLITALLSFLQEIESIDADTTSTVNDGITNSQAEEAVSSTTEDEHPMMYPAEGYDNSEGADYNKSGGIRKWTLPCVFIRYISHRFSGFYKTCMGTLIWSVLWKISCLHDIF